MEQEKFITIEFAEISKILKKQKYPYEVEEYLKQITKESTDDGLPLTVFKAYWLGIILGKRIERSKKS